MNRIALYRDNELKAQKKMALLTNYASIENVSRNEQLILKEHALSQFKVNTSTVDLLKSKSLIQHHHLSPYLLSDKQQVDISRDKNLKALVSNYIKRNTSISLPNLKSSIDVKKENIYDREL